MITPPLQRDHRLGKCNRIDNQVSQWYVTCNIDMRY